MRRPHRTALLLRRTIKITGSTTGSTQLRLLLLLLSIFNRFLSIHATTLVAIQFDHGIVIGADTRTSSNTYVSHTHNRHKIVPLNTNVVLARAGNAAMTQHLVQQLRQLQHMQLIQYNRILSVSQLAYFVRQIVYHEAQQSQPSASVELLMAGIDPRTKQCFIYTITSSGAIIPVQCSAGSSNMFATSGSGSIYITGYLQEQCEKYYIHQGSNEHNKNSPYNTSNNKDNSPVTFMNEQEAIQICRRAIEMAIYNDASSGGDICMYTISSTPESPTTTTTTSMNDNDDNLRSNTINDSNRNDREIHLHPVTTIQQRHYTFYRPISRPTSHT